MTIKPELNDICCPEFNPALWEGKTHQWENRLFVKDSIPAFLHMPIPGKIGKMMARMMNKIQEAGAEPAPEDFIILTKDCSLWRSDFYFGVTKTVPGAENTTISGTFISKVYDGPYHAIPKFMKQAKQDVEAQGHKVNDFYVFYTTCPKCAKKYGHNYMVVFAEV
ncbi:MAG: hydrolase [Bacteroidales bacterium]|nr:hypothetical protein [Bacteroidales bacterium]MDZ4204141.1 hydrolase [Bacteroidales bacterium]